MKTARDVIVALQKAAAIFAVDLPSQRTAAYIEVLLPASDPDSLCRGIASACLSSRFMPTPGEIIAASGGAREVVSAEAWTKAMALASRGNHGPCGDDAIDQTVRLIGGWSVLRLTPTNKLHFVERRFIEIYPRVAAKITERPAIEQGHHQEAIER